MSQSWWQSPQAAKKAATSLLLSADLSFFGASAANAAPLPDVMNCSVSGTAGCNKENHICVGGGISYPAVRLRVSRPERKLSLNGIDGWIKGDNDPYADGAHAVVWRWNIISFNHYRIDQPQPGRAFLTLSSEDAELEFLCLGKLNASD